MSELINVNYLRSNCCQSYTKILSKSLFTSNLSHCSTSILCKHITSALTAVKEHAIKYSDAALNSNNNVNIFGP